MSNIFINLNIPAGVGPGIESDTSALGCDKTLVADGDFVGHLVIEASNNPGGAGGVGFVEVGAFTQAGRQPIAGAFQFMRVNVKVIASGGLSVGVGADDTGSKSLNIPVPPGPGPGLSIDISALGNFTSVISSNLTGNDPNLFLEASEDGVNFSEMATFVGSGLQTFPNFIGQFARCVVKVGGGTGLLDMTACNDPASTKTAGREIPTEQWFEPKLDAGLTLEAMSAEVSQIQDRWIAHRPGSVVAMRTFLDTAIVAGIVDVFVRNVTTATNLLTVQSTSAVNPTGGVATQGEGIGTFVAGDLLQGFVTTDNALSPTDEINLEMWMEIDTLL